MSSGTKQALQRQHTFANRVFCSSCGVPAVGGGRVPMQSAGHRGRITQCHALLACAARRVRINRAQEGRNPLRESQARPAERPRPCQPAPSPRSSARCASQLAPSSRGRCPSRQRKPVDREGRGHKCWVARATCRGVRGGGSTPWPGAFVEHTQMMSAHRKLEDAVALRSPRQPRASTRPSPTRGAAPACLASNAIIRAPRTGPEGS